MSLDEAAVLREHGIQPSAQRVAVARYVLSTSDHPSADEVFRRVRRRFPMLSRATVYNTLNLFVARGILRQFVLTGGRVVFDPNVANHHHFIDVDTGEIHDVPWESIRVSDVSSIQEFEVDDYQVVIRGRKRSRSKTGKDPGGPARAERPPSREALRRDHAGARRAEAGARTITSESSHNHRKELGT